MLLTYRAEKAYIDLLQFLSAVDVIESIFTAKVKYKAICINVYFMINYKISL